MSSPETEAAAGLATLLRHHRLRAGLTQKELAIRTGLSVRAISDVEQSRTTHPRPANLARLADALGLDQQNRIQLEIAARGSMTDDEFIAVRDTEPIPPPAPVHPLLGRDAELTELITLLSIGGQRAVYLSGVVGVGKSRLAMELAQRLFEFEQCSIYWIDMDGRTETATPDPGAFSAVLSHIRDLLRAPTFELTRLTRLLGTRSALLVLDGLSDGVVSPARAQQLLQACPSLRLLVTTRASALAAGEPLYLLNPLALPNSKPTDLAQVRQVAAMQLFLFHLRQTRLGFTLDAAAAAAVASICHSLDGLPAAIESGARWSLVYSLRNLAELLSRDPFMMAIMPSSFDHRMLKVREALRDTIAQLTTEQRDLLVTGESRVWSVAEVAQAVGRDPHEVAHDVYALVLGGLVRRIDIGDEPFFRTLNVVRTLL